MADESEKRDLALAPVYDLMKKSSGIRVSKESSEIMRTLLEDITSEISKRAREFAEHADRKTVKKTDMEMAIKYFNEKKK